MLDNQQDRINVEPLFFAQGLRNCFAKFNSVQFADAGTKVPRRLLMIPHPNEFERRLMMESVAGVTMNKPARNVIGM